MANIVTLCVIHDLVEELFFPISNPKFPNPSLSCVEHNRGISHNKFAETIFHERLVGNA